MAVLHRVIVGIGSNAADREATVARACAILAARFSDFRASSIYTTPAEGSCAGAPDYCNAVALFSTDAECETLERFFKGMETDFGRTPECKTLGLVPLDIDVVVWDDCILRPRDMARDYMRIGLRQLGETSFL